VHLSSRRSDDADVIRARLRALLAEGSRRGGWVPADDADDAWSADLAGEWPVSPDEPVADQRVADQRVAEDAIAENPIDEDPGAALPRGIGRHRPPGRAVRWDPGHRGARSLWLAGLLAALLLVGWTWLDRPRVDPVPVDPAGAAPAAPRAAGVPAQSGEPARSGGPAAPAVGEVAETSATVVVSVVGLVARPGLVTLASGSRVADAVKAAGGLLPEADPASLNLAAVVADGQQVAVGVPGVADAAQGTGAGAVPPAGGGPVNLNTATVGDLDGLPGIGPVLAERIIAYRTAEGPFASVDQLDDVPGIGPAIAAKLAALVTV
jgi:competence protein ComEA